MKTKIKDLFKTSSQNTADFFTSNYMEEQMPSKPSSTMGRKTEEFGKAKLPPGGFKRGVAERLKDALKGAGKDQYANRVQTYNQYLKTLNSYKTDKVSDFNINLVTTCMLSLILITAAIVTPAGSWPRISVSHLFHVQKV